MLKSYQCICLQQMIGKKQNKCIEELNKKIGLNGP